MINDTYTSQEGQMRLGIKLAELIIKIPVPADFEVADGVKYVMRVCTQEEVKMLMYGLLSCFPEYVKLEVRKFEFDSNLRNIK